MLGRIASDLEPAARARLDEALAGIGGLRLPGQLSMTVGPDAGLRAGGWSFAIVNDWSDPGAYQAYDLDPEHNAYRAVVAEVSTELARVQLELPDPA